MNRPKVFLAHVKENEPIVRFVDQGLTGYGIDVVTDYRHIRGGFNWKRKIRELIKESAYFVLCLSKEFNDRDHTVLYRELNHAIEEMQDLPYDRTWIIPIRINECQIPNIEIRPREYLSDITYIDLFPGGSKLYEGIESIVMSIDENLIKNPQEALASPLEIEILKEMGFDMGRYTCNEIGDINFTSQREYWSQSEWFEVTPETFIKLPNYIIAIVAGTREGILSEIRLSLTINNHSDKDNAYDSFIEKCNQLCNDLCGSGLSNEIMCDLIEAKNSFTNDRIFSPHAIYTDTDHRFEGININMRNEFYDQSPLDEKPVRFRFHITRISFTS